MKFFVIIVSKFRAQTQTNTESILQGRIINYKANISTLKDSIVLIPN